MNQNQFPNGVFYGQAQPAANFAAPLQMAGQPFPASGFSSQAQPGATQAPQYYVPQQGGNMPQPRGGSSAPSQNPGTQATGSQQESVRYTQILCSTPASGKLEDLQMTVFLSLNMEKLFFEKFMSKNGNLCVGINMDLVLGDQFVSQMFGQHMVRPDHVVSVSTILAGYNARRFLEKTPNSTKVIALLLKDFRMESFSRRDGSNGVNIQASCDGFQVIHYSCKYKASDVKQCNLQESKPYHIKDKTSGVPNPQQFSQQGNNPVQQNGYPQAGPNNFVANPGMVPGVTTFSEMDDEELPF